MARIIGGGGAQNDDTTGSSNGMRTPVSGRTGGRKPSFKTRGSSGHGQHGRNIRATKVTLPASKVRELASKFNAVVVDGDIDSRATPKSSTRSATQSTSRPSSVVLATIQRFEGIIVDHKGAKGDRPKCVLVRTNSVAKERPQERLKHIPETVPEEVKKNPKPESPLFDSNITTNCTERIDTDPTDPAVPEIDKCDTSKKVPVKKKPLGERELKPVIKPKPPDLLNYRGSLGNLPKVSYKENYSKNNNRLSLPKVVILDELLFDKDGSLQRPNNSFLWGGKTEKTNEISETVIAEIEESLAEKSNAKPEVVPRQAELKIQPKSEPLIIDTTENTQPMPNSSVDETTLPAAPNPIDSPSEEPPRINLIANKSSLYRHLGRSQENVSSLKSRDNIGRSRESVASEGHSSREPSGLARIQGHGDRVGSHSSLGSAGTTATVSSSENLKDSSVNSEAININNLKNANNNRVSFNLSPERIIPKANVEGKKGLKRSPSIRSNASYEDIRLYEDMTENNYDVIANYDDTEVIYDDVLNVVSQGAAEGIYESIYSGEGVKDDSDSSLDHQNSLYDHRPASQASSGSGGRQSATSKSDTSDEWMDIELEDKDRKEEFILLEEKAKPKNIHGSWSQRVRRQWSHKIAEEFKLSRGEPSEDVYEAALYDESAILDDFDDSSDSDGEGKSGGFDLVQPNDGKSSSPQENAARENEGIYGLMMSAGKKVKKTSWSISQRLRRRMSKITIAVSNPTDVVNGSEPSSQKRWPSFKKKSKGSTSKFYLDDPNPSSEPSSLPANGSPSAASLPLVLPPFKEPKRASLELPPPPLPLVLPPFKDSRRSSPPLPAPNLSSVKSSPPPSTDGRRLSTALPSAPRPTSPPPPPPPLVNGDNKSVASKPVNDPSLYLESGLFGSSLNSAQQNIINAINTLNHTNGTNYESTKSQSTTQWYSDAGLYENTTAENGKTRRNGDEPLPDIPDRRVSNSSFYSDIGFNNKYAPSDDSGQGSQLDLQFADEPLYQFYAARVAELELGENNTDIGYEEIGPNADNGQEIYSPSNESTVSTGSGSIRPSALDLVNPESIHRTLWCQVPQVINSGILESLTANQKRLQEAKFELITSEASYYKSLTVLERTFANSIAFKDESVVPKLDYKTLFGNITPVRKCSESMLAGLEKCWQESILLDGVCEVLLNIAKEKFSAYVRYCSHQVAIERTLKRLKKNPVFFEKLAALESSPACHSLSLSSFLLLPMQRVTRLPLLLDAIMTKLDNSCSEFESCQAALMALNKVVHDCNEAARQTERLEEMGALSRALVFPKHLRHIPLMSASRWLVRSGQVHQYNPDTKLTFSKKLTAPRQIKLTLFLFTDLFFVTKKKGEDSFVVQTYCPRNFVQMSPVEDPLAAPGVPPTRFLLSIAILENHEGKHQDLMVSCNSESCRERWLQPFSRPTSEDPDQVLYETWDCPQVVASHAYPSSQPDELSLQPGDVVNVLTKMADGWFYGERLRDSEKGWFPGNYVTEVASAHVRARNLRQRHRFLALTSSYILQRQQQS